MTKEQLEKTKEQLEGIGYYEGDWKVSKNQKHNGFEWVYEDSICICDYIKDDYKRNCDRLAGTEIIRLGLGYYII
jgi:hypothetical protein